MINALTRAKTLWSLGAFLKKYKEYSLADTDILFPCQSTSLNDAGLDLFIYDSNSNTLYSKITTAFCYEQKNKGSYRLNREALVDLCRLLLWHDPETGERKDITASSETTDASAAPEETDVSAASDNSAPYPLPRFSNQIFPDQLALEAFARGPLKDLQVEDLSEWVVGKLNKAEADIKNLLDDDQSPIKDAYKEEARGFLLKLAMKYYLSIEAMYSRIKQGSEKGVDASAVSEGQGVSAASAGTDASEETESKRKAERKAVRNAANELKKWLNVVRDTGKEYGLSFGVEDTDASAASAGTDAAAAPEGQNASAASAGIDAAAVSESQDISAAPEETDVSSASEEMDASAVPEGQDTSAVSAGTDASEEKTKALDELCSEYIRFPNAALDVEYRDSLLKLVKKNTISSVIRTRLYEDGKTIVYRWIGEPSEKDVSDKPNGKDANAWVQEASLWDNGYNQSQDTFWGISLKDVKEADEEIWSETNTRRFEFKIEQNAFKPVEPVAPVDADETSEKLRENNKLSELCEKANAANADLKSKAEFNRAARYVARMTTLMQIMTEKYTESKMEKDAEGMMQFRPASWTKISDKYLKKEKEILTECKSMTKQAPDNDQKGAGEKEGKTAGEEEVDR